MNRRSKQTFLQRHTDGQKTHEKMFSVTTVREMQIKTTRGYHFTLLRMAIIKTSINNKCWKGYGEKGTLLHCWWECKLTQPVRRTVWRFFKKLKTDLPCDPAIPLLGIHLEKINLRKYTRTPIFIAPLFTIAKTWKQPKCPLTEIDKENVIHIYNGILLSHKKNEIISFLATWVGLEVFILSEVKSEEDKYHMISLICGI